MAETHPQARVEVNAQGQKRAISPCQEPCPIERGMRIIGGKWKGSILWHLKDEPVRFNDLARMLGGASKKMVNQRLKEMEEQGLIRREVLSERPVAVSYHITDFGRSSLAVLELLKDWAIEHDI
ncbi:winged helix-turn-helix transcriptional regulator [Ferrimonas balearica]|uniref:winged helix-turn-helix transcriptional regulator n=1 Tax=Ferrimonas balearica TaxID=44012 RepID=UPI001F18B8C8|nr:helix-turn-helix domain-containing protein [Ferrimonas balearica]MBY6018748.1 helix-turn-helix transcriptional regulator [Halomonas denitrificans]MBY6095938.1 helix-turn-helix transcriptional regulator [Ferrimonas balearica]